MDPGTLPNPLLEGLAAFTSRRAAALAVAVFLERGLGTPAEFAALVGVCAAACAVYVFARRTMLPRIRRPEAAENG